MKIYAICQGGIEDPFYKYFLSKADAEKQNAVFNKDAYPWDETDVVELEVQGDIIKALEEEVESRRAILAWTKKFSYQVGQIDGLNTAIKIIKRLSGEADDDADDAIVKQLTEE